MRTTPVIARLSAVASLGLLAFTNVAAAELPQHIPVQGLAPVETDVAGGSSFDAEFGHAVAIRNGFAFMGIPSAQVSTGRVAVFAQTTTGWQRIATLAAPTPASDRHFGRTLTYRDGVVVIGSDAAAYVFRQGAGKFNFVQKLVPPAADRAVEFPMALRYQDGTLFASAFRGSALPSVVYVFELDSTRKFVRRGTLTGPTNELFGVDLSMTETTLVVGSPGGHSRLRQSGLIHHGQGSAYVYQRDSNGRWRQRQRLVAPRPSGGFGSAVAIDRGMIIVGAPDNDADPFSSEGAAYGFVLDGALYVETFKLQPEGFTSGFGQQIAMFGERIVVRATTGISTDCDGYQGAAFSYTRSGSSVLPRGIAFWHGRGGGLALADDRLLVGIPCNYFGTPDPGHANFYRLNVFE